MFTKSAAKRILASLATKIEAVRELKNVVQVTYRTRKGRCSTFISKKAFERDFVEFRKAGAKSLIVETVKFQSGVFNVYNTEKKSQYVVNTQFACTCEDYQQHQKPCKHVYAVLGVGSLADAIAA
ncbi:hypothetical protein NIES2135_53460 [Leptolyngbya boryana NIES-2135]|uniref:SWIM-type domain-containing protein n=1 Tax=Leptolyngbya boryana NIES-2135 TaxID=1973484 RepID=A0A1Z4JP90_LEPBY|nr:MULTISPECIES: SWIM zinc finger family protein [Leptolyngbya]BAY58473.1 hypothetical protein NIES2135_53460 [Leptolyngbya boryana NIES-2135]MBD2370947.1 SWIM zinc finger family protein [Leptolyngbya sp. FACHB-161]MBD2377461.1 SWIM zinc finger family protein [Leptolyngbya sp. FACHB-238]MBD2401869.1 SWIM zinc finger family protein [Leptolyngbya sp. FACHB-239]MBD2408387.1 SWIM zinc finger family protein [Leptolyngbya sp. FACHB-402]